MGLVFLIVEESISIILRVIPPSGCLIIPLVSEDSRSNVLPYFSVAFTEHKWLDMSPMNDLGIFSTSEMFKKKPIIPQYFFLASVSLKM